MGTRANTQTQVQKQEQDELMYIVREDTLNFIGILFEALAVSNYFKDPSHQMCQIFKNRLITQINLSNGIYFEQRESGRDINYLKIDAADIIKKVLNTIGIDSREFKDLIDHHLNKNLQNMNRIDQIKGNFNEQPTKLSDANVQNIVNAMHHQDQQFNKLSKLQMKCEKLTQIELQTWAYAKYAEALQKLEQNFKQQGNAPRDGQMKTQIQNENNRNDQQQNQKQDLAEKQIYLLTQKIVQQWLNAAYNQKQKLDTTYKNTPIYQWQNILSLLKQNNVIRESSDQIPKIIQSIEQYLQNSKVIGPVKANNTLQKLEAFNRLLQDLQK